MNTIQNFYKKVNETVSKVSTKNTMLIFLCSIILSLYLIGVFKVIWIGIIPMAICFLFYYIRMANVYYSVKVWLGGGEYLYEKVKYKYDKKSGILKIFDVNNGEIQFQNCQFSVTEFS